MTLAEEFMIVNDINSSEANHIAGKAASELKEQRRTLVYLVQSVGNYINHEDATIRSKAIRFLFSVLQKLDENFLNRQQIHVLVEFFCARILDGGSLEALEHLQSSRKFDKSLVSVLFRAIAGNYSDLQVFPQIRRFEVYRLLDGLMRCHRKELQVMEDEPLLAMVEISSGEKDPRNLMIVFSILRAIMVEWDISKHAEVLFNSVFCYFPITFRPPPNDPFRITAQDLKDRLKDCICSTHYFAPLVFPQLIDKLDSTSSNVKRDVLQAIRACSIAFGADVMEAYSLNLWDSLKFEIFAEQEHELVSETLLTLASISSSLSSFISGAPDENSKLRTFLKPVIKESSEIYREARQRQAKGASRILGALSGSSVSAFVIIIEGVLPTIVRNFKQTPDIVSRKLQLQGLAYILEAGLVHQNLDVFVEFSSGTSFGEMKDQILALTSQALMATDEEQISYRTVALKCLQSMCLYKNLFSDSEVGLAVQHFDEILYSHHQHGRNDLRDAAIDALRDVSAHRSHIVLEISLPFLLSKLSPLEATHDLKYVHILESLSRLGECRNLNDTVIRRLFSLIEQQLLPSENPKYTTALLLTLAHVLALSNSNQYSTALDYLQKSKELVRRVAGASQGRMPLSSLNESTNMNILCRIVVSAIKGVDITDKKLAGQEVYSLFCDKPILVVLGSNAKFADDMKRTIFLSTALMAGIDSNTPLPYCPRDLPLVANHLVGLVQNEENAVLRHGLLQHLCLLTNKFITTSELRKVGVVEWIITKSGDSAFVLCQSFVQTIFWVSKALIGRLVFVDQVVNSLLDLLNDEEYGAVSAHGFSMLIAPDSIINKKNGATMRLLAGQRVICLLIPRLVIMFKSGTDSIRTNCLVALSGLVSNIAIDLSQFDVGSIVPLLLHSLSLDDTKVQLATLHTLLGILKETPDHLAGHIPTLVKYFALIISNDSDENAELRIMSLKCLRLFPGQFDETRIIPCKDRIISILSMAFDDPKRHVRKEAVDCQYIWINSTHISRNE